MLERLLTNPSSVNWIDVKHDVILDNIYKDNPRFKKMIKKDEDRFKREAIYDLSIYMP